MVTKKIQLEFANNSVKAIDHIQDIRKAAEYAGLNLFSRYDVQLQYPMPTSDDKVFVEIYIPEKIVDTFAVGNHLRGISSYLLDEKRYGDRYKKVCVGKRLLNYIEFDSEETSTDKSMIHRMDIIIDFVKLMQRSDKESMDKVNRIVSILEETNYTVLY
ncbi:hypothetical protein [Butyrivibrio sp. AE2005]|uniref:hypothetical protein n=1 Tax=Butyrivibrio sp. AE2005 TaxID=1496722 RepID=UPI00047AEB7A|nr:hypothetical protein [Butyrivibrio sp. AE2005]